MKDKSCSCGSSRQSDKSKWSHSPNQGQLIGSCNPIIPRPHVLKAGASGRGGTLLLSPAVSHPIKTQRGERGRVAARESRESHKCYSIWPKSEVRFKCCGWGLALSALKCVADGKTDGWLKIEVCNGNPPFGNMHQQAKSTGLCSLFYYFFLFHAQIWIMLQEFQDVCNTLFKDI